MENQDSFPTQVPQRIWTSKNPSLTSQTFHKLNTIITALNVNKSKNQTRNKSLIFKTLSKKDNSKLPH